MSDTPAATVGNRRPNVVSLVIDNNSSFLARLRPLICHTYATQTCGKVRFTCATGKSVYPRQNQNLIFSLFLRWSSLVIVGHRWAIHQQNNHTCSVTSTVAQTLPKLTAQKWPSESDRLPHTLLRGLDTAEPSAGNDPWLGVRPHHRSHCLSQH